MFPEDFFGVPNTTKDINKHILNENNNFNISERKTIIGLEHPKLLNPGSPQTKNNNNFNSIREEEEVESLYSTKIIIQQDHNKNINFHLEELSTRGSSKMVNEDQFNITPHFNNIYNVNNNNKSNKNDMINLTRPLTPNLNIVRKLSEPINIKKQNIVICGNKTKKNREIMHYNDYNKKLYSKNKENTIPISANKNHIITEGNIKNRTLSTSKIYTKKINSNSLCLNNSSSNVNECRERNKNSIKNKKATINSTKMKKLYSKEIPYPINSAKNKIKSQRNNSIAASRKDLCKNIKSRQKKNDNDSCNKNNKYGLKSFKSENKINVVHTKVNKEINSLFNNLPENIAKDPEIHGRIELLIKDIKDIQQAINKKTQTHFRPSKRNSKAGNK